MVSSFSCQKAYKIALGWQGKSVFTRPPRGEELSARKTQQDRLHCPVCCRQAPQEPHLELHRQPHPGHQHQEGVFGETPFPP